MSKLGNAKTLAEVGKLVAEIWGIWQDKRQANEDKERRIKELEDEIKRLKEKVK